MDECECSEEYGPCELHCETLAQRAGSSNRSADELCAVFLDDALSIDAECLSPYGLDVKRRVDEAMAALDPFSSWLEDADLAEELRDLVHQVENHLGAAGIHTYWEDGYVIVTIHGGPLDDFEETA